MSWFNTFKGHYVAIVRLGDHEHDYLGLYDSHAKALAVAKMHYHDTGKLVEVYRLEPAELVVPELAT